MPLLFPVARRMFDGCVYITTMRGGQEALSPVHVNKAIILPRRCPASLRRPSLLGGDPPAGGPGKEAAQ
eukprot:1188026-Prorocentrum_minimum.AAC.1